MRSTELRRALFIIAVTLSACASPPEITAIAPNDIKTILFIVTA